MGTHKHHIIPKHIGGTDDPSNLIEVTVEEHAEIHRKLWEKDGRWQDYVAWKALEGQISIDDLRREITRLTWLGRKHSAETKQKIKDKRKLQVCTEETRTKMSNTRKGKKLTWDLKNTTPEANAKRSAAMVGKPKPKLICPHCGKEGGAPTMKQWHFDNCKKR